MTQLASTVAVTRPGSDEYAQGFGTYVSRIGDVADAVALLTAQDETVARTLSPLDEARAASRYAPEKWRVKEVLGHLSDAERIFAYRLLRIARGDVTPLPGFDENAYVPASGSDARSLTDLLAEWRSVRAATATLVSGLPAEAWDRHGTSNGHRLTTRALLYIMLGHVDHHLAILSSRYGVSA